MPASGALEVRLCLSLSQLLTLAFSNLPSILLDNQACRTPKRLLKNMSSKWCVFKHPFFPLIPAFPQGCSIA